MYRWLTEQLRKQLALAHRDALKAGYAQDHPIRRVHIIIDIQGGPEPSLVYVAISFFALSASYCSSNLGKLGAPKMS